MDLLFTTYTIAKLEKDNGKVPFPLLLDQGTVLACREFVKAGMMIEDDRLASDKMDEYFKTGKTLQDLYLDIIGKLEDGHFLDKGAKEMAIKQAKAQKEEQKKLLSEKLGN